MKGLIACERLDQTCASCPVSSKLDLEPSLQHGPVNLRDPLHLVELCQNGATSHGRPHIAKVPKTGAAPIIVVACHAKATIYPLSLSTPLQSLMSRSAIMAIAYHKTEISRGMGPSTVHHLSWDDSIVPVSSTTASPAPCTRRVGCRVSATGT